LTENFFESAEPSCEEVPLDVVLKRFPEGKYEAEGLTLDRRKIEGEAILSHALPAIPVDLEAANDNSVTLNWGWPGEDPGLGECPFPEDANPFLEPELLVDLEDLFGFQLVVVRGEPEPLLELVVELRFDEAQERYGVDLPDGFLEPDAVYSWEVLAIGAGVDPESPHERDSELRGSQVIAESEFCTDASGQATGCPEGE
jgi:hypothetical protein